MNETRHDPQVYTTGRHGSWCVCSCGWKSRSYVGQAGAHLEFGEHLVAAKGDA